VPITPWPSVSSIRYRSATRSPGDSGPDVEDAGMVAPGGSTCTVTIVAAVGHALRRFSKRSGVEDRAPRSPKKARGLHAAKRFENLCNRLGRETRERLLTRDAGRVQPAKSRGCRRPPRALARSGRRLYQYCILPYVGKAWGIAARTNHASVTDDEDRMLKARAERPG
jgi:hypothetical protein